MIGIYKITNMLNQKSYIGQSVDIEKRFQRHKEDAFNVNSQAYEYPLYRSIRKYGIDNFSFEIIEICNDECLLNDREIYWINYYNTYYSGYNQTLGGQNVVYQKITPQLLEEITITLQNNPLMKHSDIAQKYNVSVEMIQGINTGRYWHRNLQYPLQNSIFNKRTGQLKQINVCEKCGKEVSKGNHLCPECAHLLLRKVDRPDADVLLKEIATSSFTAVGKKYGVSDKAIVKWCVSYGLPTHKKEIVELYRSLKI